MIVAARTVSKRLPGKALLPLGGLPMVVFLLRRLLPSREAAEIVLATTVAPEDDRLAQVAEAAGVRVYRGAEDDVVARFVDVALLLDAEYVARVTADCPFLDAATLDYCLDACRSYQSFDLATTKGSFPVGLDVEVYRARRLASLHTSAVLDADDREHVTRYFYDHADAFTIKRIPAPADWPATGRVFTVDTEADYAAARALAATFGDAKFPVTDLLATVAEPR